MTARMPRRRDAGFNHAARGLQQEIISLAALDRIRQQPDPGRAGPEARRRNLPSRFPRNAFRPTMRRRARSYRSGLFGIRIDLDVPPIVSASSSRSSADSRTSSSSTSSTPSTSTSSMPGCGQSLLDALFLGDVAARAARPRLLRRLFGAAFRADRGRPGQVVKSGPAGDANSFRCQVLASACGRPFVRGMIRVWRRWLEGGGHATGTGGCQTGF